MYKTFKGERSTVFLNRKMSDVLILQITMLILIIVGAVIKRIGIISETGQKNINDLVIYLVLPCNIVKSFMIDCDSEVFRQFALVLLISIGVQIVSVVIGKLLYSRKELGHRMSLQYGVICSNAGFLGNPVAEGLYGSVGLAMASVYLIPMRIMMWSSGIAVYTKSTNWKSICRKVLTHPCIIACVLGILLMGTGYQLPEVIEKPLTYIGNCNTALSMMVIGMILYGNNLLKMVDGKVLCYCLMRLVIMPLLLLFVCQLLKMPSLVTGVCVTLTAMPAGATTSILASKYQANEFFATKLVLVSTILSMVTIPAWQMVLGML